MNPGIKGGRAMNKSKLFVLDSPFGKTEIDHLGSPAGVVRMDASKSYSGIGKLLQQSDDAICCPCVGAVK